MMPNFKPIPSRATPRPPQPPMSILHRLLNPVVPPERRSPPQPSAALPPTQRRPSASTRISPQRRWSCFLSLSLLFSSTASLWLSSADPGLTQVPSSVREAYTLMEQGLVNQAIAIFEQAVQQYPQSVEAQLGLAIAYRRAGRDTAAFQAYERVLDLDPNNTLALYSLGILAGFRIEWQDQGIAALSTLLTLEPNNTAALAQRALLYGYQGQFGRAIADYEIVLQSNPAPDAIYGAAQVYAYNGDYDLALELFERYQTLGGTIADSGATAYAVALRETGNAARAAQILESELRQRSGLDGITIRMRAELGADYGALGELQRAEAVLQPLRGRRDSRMILSRSLLALTRYSGDPSYIPEVLALYEEVLTQEPVYLTLGIGREIADILSGFPAQRAYALDIYRQLLAQQPGDRGLQIQQAVLERELGLISRDDLRQQVEAALTPLPPDRYQQKLIAQALLQLEYPNPELLPYYQALLDANVNEPLLYVRIAQIQVQQSQFAAARDSLSQFSATPLGQRQPYIGELLLAEIERREGNLEASAQRYEQMIRQNPPDSGVLSGALQGLAGIRQTQNRLPEAIALYDQLIALNPQNPALPLGRASLAYQADLISEAEAEAVLANWLAVYPLTYTPPELYSLAGALPPDPSRESLYQALLVNDPDSLPIQLRQVQVLADRDPAAADAYVRELIARNPEQLGGYFVQAELAAAQGELGRASQAYIAILEQDPANVDALSALGGIRFQQRRYSSAARLYNEVLELEPNNQVALLALLDLQAIQGRRLAALQQLETLQLQRTEATGEPDPELSQQIQRIEEGFLRQRGFQPPWERY